MAVTEEIGPAAGTAGVTFMENPVVSAATGLIVANSVVPVRRGAGHVIEPDALHAIAASDGFLHHLEDASLDHALSAVATRPGDAAIVRVSAASLEAPDFVAHVAARMAAAGASQSSLWLEVDDAAQVIAHPDLMRALARYCITGCQIHDGDIVTTRSALGDLAAADISFITLTPELTHSATSETADAIMMRSLTRRANLNDMTVLARGLDTDRRGSIARTLGIGLIESAGDAA